jgi:hypothetical protein
MIVGLAITRLGPVEFGAGLPASGADELAPLAAIGFSMPTQCCGVSRSTQDCCEPASIAFLRSCSGEPI